MRVSESQEAARAPDRVEWLELFFDLVVVAAVAVLSETLREDATYRELGLFLISYAAVWFAWVSVVMYADVAGELTRVRTVIVSMFLGERVERHQLAGAALTGIGVAAVTLIQL